MKNWRSKILLLVLCLVPAAPPAAQAEPAPLRRVVVGGDRDYPPYEFIDRDGKPAGYNVDLTRAIAKVLGIEVEFRFGGWSEMREAMMKGEVDILQGISYSEERSRILSFSPPHTIVSHAVFARRGTRKVSSLEELRGKKVIVFRSGIMHDYLTSNGFHDLLLTATPADALRLLASGSGDYVVTAMLPGLFIIREHGLSNVVPVAEGIASHRYGYAVRKGNEELLARFSEGLAILKKTGEYRAVYDRWLGVLEPPRLSVEKVLKWGGAALAALLAVLAGIGAWTRTLQRRVARRTAELATEVAEKNRALEELRLQQDRLVQADKMASLGILVSGVAHEINHPTGLILMNMPILRDVYADAEETLLERYRARGDFTLGGLPFSRMREEVPRMLEEMHEGGMRIKRIVEELKDFSRREEGGRMEPCDLNEVVRTAVRLAEATIRKSTSRFGAEYAEGLPKVAGNPQRIEQVVVNLLLNACQSLPDASCPVSLATFREEGMVAVRVTDGGSGILPEHLPHLTDPFFTTRRESGG
ncbi:MAG TPA: transporter substrate-binding domain-containing protein, partial [Verrucomicrobiae bacterium]|nr:transporter substrate-binding domain-containing protein [Verrucomicrobiae bacterium]